MNNLTEEQKIAFRKFREALVECKKAGLKVFSIWGVLTPVNGKALSFVDESPQLSLWPETEAEASQGAGKLL